MSQQDIETGVRRFLGGYVDNHDVDAIVEEIGTTYGYDLRSIDQIPREEFWPIVERHGRPE